MATVQGVHGQGSSGGSDRGSSGSFSDQLSISPINGPILGAIVHISLN